MSRRFLTQFLAFALACFAALYGLKMAFGPAIIHPAAPAILGGWLLLTLAGYAITAWATARAASLFMLAYFAGVGLRLVLALGLVLAYVLGVPEASKTTVVAFVGALLTTYFLCAGFEIWAIFSNLRPFSGGQAS